MSVKTNNIYGRITISDRTIEKFVLHVATDCYGIVAFSNENIFRSMFSFLKFGCSGRNVSVRSVGDRIFIDMSVIVKYGVSIKAVVDSLKESIKYKVEKFTGMIVDTINVNVTGVTH
ncbi:MAG: Asp23/Gls24 family envelope stress response protein [Clostridiales bacterium]|nr:Asp23/Gls24 family envelope stress response protein [Clostridiales bacterium]